MRGYLGNLDITYCSQPCRLADSSQLEQMIPGLKGACCLGRKALYTISGWPASPLSRISQSEVGYPGNMLQAALLFIRTLSNRHLLLLIAEEPFLIAEAEAVAETVALQLQQFTCSRADTRGDGREMLPV